MELTQEHWWAIGAGVYALVSVATVILSELRVRRLTRICVRQRNGLTAALRDTMEAYASLYQETDKAEDRVLWVAATKAYDRQLDIERAIDKEINKFIGK